MSAGILACLMGASAWAQGVSPKAILLETDRPFYLMGEPVKFTLTNYENLNLETSAAPYKVTKGSKIVYAPKVMILVLYSIAPNGSKSWSWNQKDDSGKQVVPGIYTITVKTKGTLFTRSVQFEIVSKSGGKIVTGTTKGT